MASSAEDMPPPSDTNNASSPPMVSSILDNTSSMAILTQLQPTSAVSSPDIDSFPGDTNSTTDFASSMNVPNTKRKRGNSSLPEPNDELVLASDSDSDPDEHVPKKLKTAVETTAEKAVEGQKKDYFPLMELPREIRDIVYFWAFCERTPPILGYAAEIDRMNSEYGWQFDSRADHLRVQVNLGFTLMNRQTRVESMPALMSRPYTFYKPQDLLSFLVSVGPSNCAFLKDILLENWDDTLVMYPERHTVAALRLSAFRLLAKARLIKSFSIRGLLSMRHENYEIKELAGCCFDELRGVFKSISCREGAKDAGMDVFHFGNDNFCDMVGGTVVHNVSRKAVFEAELRKLLLEVDC